MKKKSFFLRICTILSFIGYFFLTAFLVYQATLDGKESSSQSGAVGEEISGIINDSKGDQTILIDPESLIINNIISEGKVGNSHKLNCTTLPDNASYKSLVYNSSNSSVATISTKGLIKFVGEGTTTITVSNNDFPDISESFNIDVTKINLQSFSSSLYKGKKEVTKVSDVYQIDQYESYDVHHSFNPSNDSIKKVTYSYDTKYISISNDVVYAKKPTTEPITVTMKCDGKTDSFKISIKEVIIVNVDLIDYSIEKNKLNINVNESVSLNDNPFMISFNPSNASNKTLTYVSQDESIIKISKNILTGVGVGTTKIQITSSDKNITKEVEVEVINVITLEEEKFTIEQDYFKFDEKTNSYHIRNGLSGTIHCNFTTDSTFDHVTYASSNEEILLIGADGTLTPIKTGKVTITVTIDDGYSEPLEYELNFVVDGKPFIENLSEFYYFIRKSIGHFGAFFVLGCFGTFGFMLLWDKKKWLYSLPINVALGFGVGALTEYIQTLVPGRYGCWSDIWLDFSGYGSATLIMALVIFTIYIISYFKNKKKLV